MTESKSAKIYYFIFLFLMCFHLVRPWPKGYEEDAFDFDSPLVADEVPSYFNQGKIMFAVFLTRKLICVLFSVAKKSANKLFSSKKKKVSLCVFKKFS